MPKKRKPSDDKKGPQSVSEDLFDQIDKELKKLWERHSGSRKHFAQAGMQLLLGIESFFDELLDGGQKAKDKGKTRVKKIKVEQ